MSSEWQEILIRRRDQKSFTREIKLFHSILFHSTSRIVLIYQSLPLNLSSVQHSSPINNFESLIILENLSFNNILPLKLNKKKQSPHTLKIYFRDDPLLFVPNFQDPIIGIQIPGTYKPLPSLGKFFLKMLLNNQYDHLTKACDVMEGGGNTYINNFQVCINWKNNKCFSTERATRGWVSWDLISGLFVFNEAIVFFTGVTPSFHGDNYRVKFNFCEITRVIPEFLYMIYAKTKRIIKLVIYRTWYSLMMKYFFPRVHHIHSTQIKHARTIATPLYEILMENKIREGSSKLMPDDCCGAYLRRTKVNKGNYLQGFSARRCLRYETSYRSKYRFPGLKKVSGSHVLRYMWLWNVPAHTNTPKNEIMLFPREIPLQKIQCGVFIGEAVAAAEADQSKQRKVSSGQNKQASIGGGESAGGELEGGFGFGCLSGHWRRIRQTRVVLQGAAGGQDGPAECQGGPEGQLNQGSATGSGNWRGFRGGGTQWEQEGVAGEGPSCGWGDAGVLGYRRWETLYILGKIGSQNLKITKRQNIHSLLPGCSVQRAVTRELKPKSTRHTLEKDTQLPTETVFLSTLPIEFTLIFIPSYFSNLNPILIQSLQSPPGLKNFWRWSQEKIFYNNIKDRQFVCEGPLIQSKGLKCLSSEYSLLGLKCQQRGTECLNKLNTRVRIPTRILFEGDLKIMFGQLFLSFHTRPCAQLTRRISFY
ncbi:hypothetical protein VP01_1197g1 [Puccinia sorghi]|uniref:Uncharacterized protein n=1 Tax=Puccinia sorghi TaxID=27349 RepID=A0A0L6VQQ6_9BASI|nr:hypothetical protein VP01_1197g1 [Puccinia sorghi]